MTETARTVTFVVIAALAVGIAWVATPPVARTPAELAGANEGKEFFPQFKDYNEPSSIRVVGFDEARAAMKPFAVEFKDGLWTIPSHHDYPADGATRLGKTAAKMVGIKREKYKSGSEQDHEQLGVVDPMEKDLSKLKGRGQRITLSKGDAPLVDLIVGKPVRDQPGYYYVRAPGEKSTYAVKLDLDLSTKFADWVETDLLKLNRDELQQIVIDKYKFDPVQRNPVDEERIRLEHAKSTDPWKLEGLDDNTEELETAKVNDLVGTLDDLKLVGVRPKPKGIGADLSIDREVVQNQLQLSLLQEDLRMHGFVVGQEREDDQKFRLYAHGGELDAATSKGVVYTLRFGDIFSGDESELEFGGKKSEPDDPKADEKEAASADDAKDNPADEKSAGKQPGRYLFVSVRFDEARLGAVPEKPAPPEGLSEDVAREVEQKFEKKPKIRPRGRKGERPQAPEEEKDDAKDKEEECGPTGAADDDANTSVANPAEETPENEQPAAKGDAEPAQEPPAEKKKSADELKKDYQTLFEKYDADLKAHEGKVKEAEEKVAELNLRFGDWYYVISGDSYKKLHLGRKDLVKEKTPAADDDKPAASPDADDGDSGKPEDDE